MANFRKRKFISLLLLFFLVAAVSFFAGIRLSENSRSQKTLPVLGSVPQYTLTNQTGQKVSSKNFSGKIRVVSFLFPYCKEYCPLIAINMVNLEGLLKSANLADRVQLITYNVDPDGTGPQQMRTFMQQYGWNPDNVHWQYLTGTPDQIKRIVQGAFYVSYERVSEQTEDSLAEIEKRNGTFVPSPEVKNDMADKINPNYDIVHNDALAIVDAKGRIRKIYDDADHVSNVQILNLINSLLSEH